jgi:hypothetical protein
MDLERLENEIKEKESELIESKCKYKQNKEKLIEKKEDLIHLRDCLKKLNDLSTDCRYSRAYNDNERIKRLKQILEAAEKLRNLDQKQLQFFNEYFSRNNRIDLDMISYLMVYTKVNFTTECHD